MGPPDLIALSNLPWDSYFPTDVAPLLGREARTHVGTGDAVAPWLTPAARTRLEAEAIGGSPTNVALAFAGLGGRARVIGPVANDAWGDRVRGALAAGGLTLVEVTPPPPRQAHSLAFREAEDPTNREAEDPTNRGERGPGDRGAEAPPLRAARGERRFLASLPEVPAHATLPAVDWAGPGWIVASSYEFRNPRFGALIREAFAAARSAGRRLALDLADPHAVRERRGEIRALLAEGLDLLQGATEALEALCGEGVGTAGDRGVSRVPATAPAPDAGAPSWLDAGAPARLDAGTPARLDAGTPARQDAGELDAATLRTLAPIVIETRGANGSRLVTPTLDRQVAALPVGIVDTTGAGDALLGAVLFGLARGDTPQAALELGRAAAAECVRQVGAHVPAERLRALAGMATPGRSAE